MKIHESVIILNEEEKKKNGKTRSRNNPVKESKSVTLRAG